MYRARRDIFYGNIGPNEWMQRIGGSVISCIVGAFLDIWGALWIGALGSIAGHECLLSPWASVLFGIMSPYVEYAQERV